MFVSLLHHKHRVRRTPAAHSAKWWGSLFFFLMPANLANPRPVQHYSAQLSLLQHRPLRPHSTILYGVDDLLVSSGYRVCLQSSLWAGGNIHRFKKIIPSFLPEFNCVAVSTKYSPRPAGHSIQLEIREWNTKLQSERERELGSTYDSSSILQAQKKRLYTPSCKGSFAPKAWVVSHRCNGFLVCCLWSLGSIQITVVYSPSYS